MRNRYSQEFRDSSVQLALNGEKSVFQTAKDLGITDTTLSTWLIMLSLGKQRLYKFPFFIC